MTIDRAADSAAAERMRRAAIEAFAESGYGGSSTRQIAKRLNMSATAMYPHYRSKEELLYAIALEGHSSLLAELESADDPAAGFTDRLRAVVAAFASWHARNHKQARVVQYELHGLTPAHYRTIAPLRHQVTDVITAIVAGGVASGDLAGVEISRRAIPRCPVHRVQHRPVLHRRSTQMLTTENRASKMEYWRGDGDLVR